MGKFVIKQTNTGYNFHLKAANGETIATGEVYKTLDACRNGVESIMKNAPVANVEDQTVENFETLTHPKFEIYKDKAGEFRFRLKSKDGVVIATGESYTTKANCKNGVASVMKNAENAEIIEQVEE